MISHTYVCNSIKYIFTGKFGLCFKKQLDPLEYIQQRMVRRIHESRLAEIQSMVAPKEKTKAHREKEEKKALSQARMRTWPDTLEAQRHSKEKAYYARIAKEEEVRVENDRIEDARRTAERRDKIQYATKAIYKQTDKAKRLASAELLSDCLHSRALNDELNQKIKACEATWELQFLEQDKQRAAKMLARETKEADERMATAKMVTRVQQEQLAQLRERREVEREENRKEGERLIDQAKADEEMAKQKLRDRAMLIQQANTDTANANKELEKGRDIAKAKDMEEDAKIEEFARQKADLKKRQMEQQNKIAEQKQRRRNEMVEQGAKRLAAINAANNSRLDRDVAQAKLLENEKLMKLAESRVAFEKTIDDSRKHMIEFRRNEKELEEQKDREHAIRWKAYNVGASHNERLELLAEERESREHQQVLLIQAAEKRDRELEEKRESIFQAKRLETQAQDELDDFNRLAKERLRIVQQAGKDTFPMRQCIRDVNRGR